MSEISKGERLMNTSIKNFLLTLTGRVILGTFVLGAVVCLRSNIVSAQPAEPEAQQNPSGKEEEAEPVAKPGEIIASSGATGNFAAVPVASNGSAPGDNPSVLSASVNRTKGNNCVAKMINSGKKTYSVYFAVVGSQMNGSQVFRRTYSVTVKPGSSVERTVNGCGDVPNVNVVLSSVKALD